MSRRLKILAVTVAALAVLYGLSRIWLGGPVAHDSYRATSDDAIEFVPARCRLNKIGLGCRARFLRLYGIDILEPTQRCRDAHGRLWSCGAAAAERLKALVETPDFSCQAERRYFDDDGRQFARCIARGADVGGTLVADGLAFAYGRGLEYLPFEAAAKAARRGAWAGQFIRPQYYRQGAREPSGAAAVAAPRE